MNLQIVHNPTETSKNLFGKLFEPRAKVSAITNWTLFVGWLLFTIFCWQIVIPHMSKLVPMPSEVMHSFATLWKQGLIVNLSSGNGGNMVASIITSLSAIFIAMILGLSLSYLSTISFFSAPVRAIGSGRVLSLTGMTFIFVLATPNGFWLKVATLTFSIVVFLINSMLQVIDDIPESKFDHARTLGLSKIQVLYEVVIRGTLASAFDIIRMNAAMAYMMLAAVEANSRSDGGIGIVLIELARQSNYAGIFAVQLMIFVVGMGQDQLIQFVKNTVCPYTKTK
jgi:NitT/TauT family transport system permease protein